MRSINISLLFLLLTMGLGTQAGETEVQENDESSWDQAGDYWDDAGKKAKSAWEATKRYSTDVMEESSDYYDAAVDKSKEMGSSLSEKSRSAWEQTKEISSDLADQAGELYDEATREQETESTQKGIWEI